MTKHEEEMRYIRDFIQSIHFDSMDQAKRVMEQLVYERVLPNVYDLIIIAGAPFDQKILDFGYLYFWTNLKNDILSNKYGAAHRKNITTKQSYFVLQLPPPERVDDN